MTEYTKYVAFDGEEFDNECDCLAYERKMQAINFEGEIFFYDINGKPIPLYTEDLNKIFFIDIKTEKACQWFIDSCDKCGSRHPWNYDPDREEDFPMTGFFWFDTDNYIWHHWQIENKKLNEIRDYFQLSGED